MAMYNYPEKRRKYYRDRSSNYRDRKIGSKIG